MYGKGLCSLRLYFILFSGKRGELRVRPAEVLQARAMGVGIKAGLAGDIFVGRVKKSAERLQQTKKKERKEKKPRCRQHSGTARQTGTQLVGTTVPGGLTHHCGERSRKEDSVVRLWWRGEGGEIGRNSA